MKKSSLRPLSKIFLLIGAAGLCTVLLLPIWRIELNAPQYPEGLKLQIHANGIKGDVDIINGLNHYIGMKTLHNEDFVEFTLLPYLIIFFAALFLITALINKRKWLYGLLILFVTFGVVAMADFWKWEYNYGHNLNPDAAIKVPGMAYQPPLIGFKQLLNFGAYSIPDTGGWIFVGAGVLLLISALLEWKQAKQLKNTLLASVSILIFTMNSCNAKPETLVLGKDNCYLCKMTVTDARFGGEIISTKGRIFKFDDIHCLVSFINSNGIEKNNIKDIYLVDYSDQHELLKAENSFLYHSEQLRSPMNGNIAAFATKEKREAAAASLKGENIEWNSLLAK
jgi:copper chaperone NosL